LLCIDSTRATGDARTAVYGTLQRFYSCPR
jgi:hypothetical protein